MNNKETLTPIWIFNLGLVTTEFRVNCRTITEWTNGWIECQVLVGNYQQVLSPFNFRQPPESSTLV